MELEIIPEPSAEERAAIAAAFATLLATKRDTPSPWWEAGVREAIEPDEAER